MPSQITITVGTERISIRGPYSTKNNTVWRSLGGTFTDGQWTIPDNTTSRQRIAELFGEKSEDVQVLIPCSTDGEIIQCGGYVLAEGVSLASGTFPSSGGSVKNPRVSPSDGLVFRAWVRQSFATANSLAIVPEVPEANKISI